MANTKTASFVTITDLNDSVPLIRGTQAAVTGTWTGVAPFRSLENGQQISYLLPFNGSGNATLNLTLDGGGTTGAIPCYYGGTSRLTTHYGAGNIIRLTYIVNNLIAGTNYTGWWADANYTDGNTYDRIKYNRVILAKTAITASRLIVSDQSGYFHLAAGSVFDVDKPILFTSSAIAAGATGTNNYTAYHQLSVTGNFPGATFAAYKTVYLKGAVIGTAFTVDATTPITDQPVNTPDAVYMLLGQSYSTTAITLLPQHEIYRFHAGVLKTIAQIASEAVINAEMAQESADDAWDAVNNISIGGRNLILQSDTVRNSVTATLQTYNISEAFTSRVYTFSMRAVGATGTTYTLKQNGGATSLGSLVSDANGIFSLTFTSNQTEEYLQTFLITQSPLPSEDNSIIWAKLEYGNKYTDYTQAPEDIEAQINDLIERTNTNETDINRKITVFTGTQTPTGAKTGDIWINGNDGDRQYIYGEGMWTLFGKTDLDLLNEQINTLSSIAFGGANVYRQISAPSSQHENDMWIDTDDNNKVYTYKGGTWVVIANFNNLLKMINDIDVSMKDGSTLSTLLDSNSILQKLKDNLRLDSNYVRNTAEYDNLMRSISDGLQGLKTTVYGDPAVGVVSLENLINAQKLDEGLKALLNGYNIYMRQAGQYPNDYLQIARKQGDVISPFEIRITNERIDFMYQGESIAHCSTSDFNMEVATIDQYSRHIYRNATTDAKVGEFQMIAVDGGLQGLWISTTT